ncbi:hypothetical protein CHL76_08560 [Marinococcus halophilus]|uniref:CWH43-like N-terminal domain-containing protein n=1 Tax=Marinococcus halophilus TaxID=1371 RepID=A0A510Y4D4_MARHA|nr:hypothetical protein [Marinococcus halophilus]OZT80148.1 hypothetical protein CHL76_08560 [Marinococcus halophilus]GEK58198.1 hypothetical protein MHA01_11030 [Marinococcus halophilus]
MDENLWFIVELFSSLLLIGAVMSLMMNMTRRWYVKRNGQERSKHYANNTHQKVTRWFAIIIVFLLLSITNLGGVPIHLTLLFVVVPLFLLYMTFGTYLWKKESDNKDDYWYDWRVAGGTFICLAPVMIAYQWWMT